MGMALAANPLGILIGSLVSGRCPIATAAAWCWPSRWSPRWRATCSRPAALVMRNYPLFVLARFATGLVESNTAVARAMLADLHEQIDRTRAFALLNACMYAGWLLGPLVGGLTLPLGEPVPFVLAAAMTLPCVAILFLGLPARRGADGRGAPARATQRAGAAARRPHAGHDLRAAAGLHAGAEHAVRVLAAVDAAERRLRQPRHRAGDGGPVRRDDARPACWPAASAAPARPSRCGAPRRARWSAAVCLSLMAVLPGRLGIFVIMAMGFPTAMYNAVMPAWMSERFAEHGQGRIMGLLSTIFCVSNVAWRWPAAGSRCCPRAGSWRSAAAGVSAVLMLRLARRRRCRMLRRGCASRRAAERAGGRADAHANCRAESGWRARFVSMGNTNRSHSRSPHVAIPPPAPSAGSNKAWCPIASSAWASAACSRSGWPRCTPATPRPPRRPTRPSSTRCARAPIALVPEKANEQHYEVPAEFFAARAGPAPQVQQLLLGRRRRRRSAQAEAAALRVTCERAGLRRRPGHARAGLRLGLAEPVDGRPLPRQPHHRGVELALAAPLHRARRPSARGLVNLRVITCDVNDFETEPATSTASSRWRCSSTCATGRTSSRASRGWLKPDGRFFMHVFAHRGAPYAFVERDASDWMSRHFFSGGMMPGDDLALQLPGRPAPGAALALGRHALPEDLRGLAAQHGRARATS